MTSAESQLPLTVTHSQDGDIAVVPSTGWPGAPGERGSLRPGLSGPESGELGHRCPAGARGLRGRMTSGSVGSGRPHVLRMSSAVTRPGLVAPSWRTRDPPRSNSSPWCKMGVRQGLSPRVSCEQATDEVHLGTAELQSIRGSGPRGVPPATMGRRREQRILPASGKHAMEKCSRIRVAVVLA